MSAARCFLLLSAWEVHDFAAVVAVAYCRQRRPHPDLEVDSTSSPKPLLFGLTESVDWMILPVILLSDLQKLITFNFQFDKLNSFIIF